MVALVLREIGTFVVAPLHWGSLLPLLGLVAACTGERFSQGGDAGGHELGIPDSAGAEVHTANDDMTSGDDLLGRSQGDDVSGNGFPLDAGRDDQLDDVTEEDDSDSGVGSAGDSSPSNGDSSGVDDLTDEPDDAPADDGTPDFSLPSEVDASSRPDAMKDPECSDAGVCEPAPDDEIPGPEGSNEPGMKPEAGASSAAPPEAGPVIPDCPEDSLLGPNNHCYFISEREDDWDGSRQRCLERGEGWDLVSILDEAEHQWLTSRLVEDTWIGASDAEETDTWVWVDTQTVFWRGKQDGSPVDDAFNIWFNGGPTDVGAVEQCGRYTVREGAWYFADIPCGRDYSFACEWATN